MKSSHLIRNINFIPVIVFIVFVTGILLTGLINYNYHKNKILKEKELELASIAHLKVEQIEHWKREQMEDVNALLSNTLIANQISAFLENRNRFSSAYILSIMHSFIVNYGYQNISLIDPDGKIKLALPEGDTLEHSTYQSLFSSFKHSLKTRFIILPKHDKYAAFHLDLLVPVKKTETKDSFLIATILLHINPSEIFVPLIQSKITTDRGIETLLTEYQPNGMSYIGLPRSKKNTGDTEPSHSFNLQLLNLIEKNGEKGTFEEANLKKDPVMVSYRKVSETPWYVVVAYHKKDMNAALKKQFTLSVLIISFFILIVGALTATWWWYQRLLYFKRLYSTELKHKTLARKYEFLVKFAYDIIILTDSNLYIIEFNYRALEVFGYSREEMSKMNIFDLHATETLSKIAAKINILNIEQATFFETLDKRKDGSVFQVEYSARLFDIDGEKYYQFIGRDISDRRNAEEELDRIFNLVPDMICVTSSDGYFQRLNPAWEKTLGYSIKTMLEKPFSELIHPDDLKPTINEVQKQLKGQSTESFINRYRCIDGSYKWFDWVANPSPDGELLFAAARDITARKQAEDERETMIRLLRLLNSRSSLQNLTLSILSFLKEISGCQAIAIRLKEGDDYPYYETLGFSPEFIMNENSLLTKCPQGIMLDKEGKALLECNCGDILSKQLNTSDSFYTPYGSFWSNCLSENIPNPQESNHLAPRRNRCLRDGYQSIALLPLHMGGEIFGLIQINDKQKDKFSMSLITFIEKLAENIAIAISQRRSQEELIESNLRIKKINEELTIAIEKAKESDRLKSAFLANMSHEIRTPMNAVIGFTEILLKPDLSNEKKSRYAGLIKQRSHDLLRIIEDVLDISKIEVGQMKVIVSEVNISLLLNELYEYYRLKKENNEAKSGIALKLLLPHDLNNVRIKTDSLRLKQVLNNLLDNALKFTQKGSIEFGCRQEPGNLLLFFVKDTGIGISPQKHKVIFDPFRQAEDSVFARQYGGVGLGLSIVKGMVTLMKGEIWLESEPEKGTTFYFTIPFIPLQAVVEPVLESPDAKIRTWKNNTLLVVEDDEINSLCINEMLTDTGIKILNAFSGQEALHLFKNEPSINMVLMDIRLPDTTGLVLTPIFKKKKPQTIIIAQTAYASPEDAQECIEAGCDDYIAKPIIKQKLMSVIDKYLDKKDA
jgi:PAS domain S-box-containing protein